MKDYILEEYQKSRALFDAIIADPLLLCKVAEISEICYKALKNGGKIMLCGNGGSAADSQHLAAELVSKLSYDRPALHAIALTTDTSAITAIGNDYGYQYLFSRQVEAIGNQGDVLIGISTSGRSANIIEAMKVAKIKNVVTVGLLGKDGRNIGALSDYQINIPSTETPKIQEAHIATGHIICGIIEDRFFGKTHN